MLLNFLMLLRKFLESLSKFDFYQQLYILQHLDIAKQIT